MAGEANKARVRPARPGEMPAIRDLIRRYPNQLAQADLPRLPSFFVATAGGEIVGCCALQVYSKRLAEVRSLAVHPDHLGQGIASQLVDACRRRAERRKIKQLLAVTSDASFFEKRGFKTFLRERTALFYDVPKKRSR